MKLVKKGNIIYDEDLLNKKYVFNDRFDAGSYLGIACKKVFSNINIVYAVPRGGVPVGYEVAKILNTHFDLIICRKLLIPWNREAGFGAVDIDGNVYIDKDYAYMLGLTKNDINKAIEEQVNEIKYRNKVLRGNRGYPNLTGKSVILVDDGIAAGYTMKVAINFMKSKKASRIYIAVPTGSLDSIMKLSGDVDEILCLNIRRSDFFAVADAYKYWTDLTDDDIIKLLHIK